MQNTRDKTCNFFFFFKFYIKLISYLVFNTNLRANFIMLIDLAKSGQLPPDGFMAPKAWDILAKYYQGLNAK